ncbi:MAG TPA: UDP-N-acetylmuramoylalanyl-D-glutamyl-2,6-diaminopimelate--D-alanyl-D-alanine ligase [Terriglobia bacterium]|nr:UDP-N-acetylmuramoylalanyl-D-glutamyl-2,6-diaminopimelate--D-alanyl-D-alanine ligase [Terriglobia bacterium]
MSALAMKNDVLWNEAEATIATRGAASGTFEATGVSIDSRTVEPGDLFVALKGPNFDGHAFVTRAFAAGACAAIVSERPADLPEAAPLLLVKDTMAALWDLGRAARARSAARFGAVTGSVGKTSTKEALRQVLAASAPTYASTGNLNNHWGAPLSLARVTRDAVYGIFELGMNHAGEISPLSKLVRPEVAIITTIDAAHLEFFKSVAEIADAKAEIFDGLEESGTALLPADNMHFSRLVERARARHVDNILSFGRAVDADIRLIACEVVEDGNWIEADLLGDRVTYRTRAPGHHHAINSLAVLGAVRALGADLDKALTAFAQVEPFKGRGKRESIALADGSLTLIDESYNASPVAVRAALNLLGNLTPGTGGRRVAILGDMRELGPQSGALHQALAPDLIAAGIEQVFLVGPFMRELESQLPSAMRAGHAAQAEELSTVIGGKLRANDIVLVKGSLGTNMAPIVAAIRALDITQAVAPKRAANGH